MSSATDFWQEHQVGGPYRNASESLRALEERAELFPELQQLMPVSFPGKTILDFGCGPGHDTILFLNNGAAHVYYADVSWQALHTTTTRLTWHGVKGRATALFHDDELPRVDHVHCAGVLHHMHDPLEALVRLRHCAPQARVMVYDGKKSTHSQSLVPITEWWTPRQFLSLAEEAGWAGTYVGSYECSAEWRPNCWAACFALE